MKVIAADDDCRDGEHFFLQLIKRYRLHGDEFRSLINTAPDPAVRARRFAQYAWLKQHWYQGAEFKSGNGGDPIVGKTHGLLCLPGECPVSAPPPPPPPPPPTREHCLRDCRTAQQACLDEGELPRVCVQQARQCRLECG